MFHKDRTQVNVPPLGMSELYNSDIGPTLEQILDKFVIRYAIIFFMRSFMQVYVSCQKDLMQAN